MTAAPDGDSFRYFSGELHCDGVALTRIVRAVDTPCYVYSSAAVRSALNSLTPLLYSVPHRVHYSAKANSNLAILALLRSLGAGVDVVSGGELRRAALAGFTGPDIVFGGVGKSDEELLLAVEQNLKLINVESEGELHRLSEIACAAGLTSRVALRINPEVTVETPHPYTRTGERGMKFGIPYDRGVAAALKALELPGIELCGIDFHIGSQIFASQPYRRTIERVAELVGTLRAEGAASLRYLDAGGGLGVAYDDAPAPDLAEYAAVLVSAARQLELELIIEPGRFLLGNAGVLLARVIDTKHSGGRDFVILDTGMNDLIRPSLYNSFHRITAVVEGEASKPVDLVGPVCESGDFLGLDRELPSMQPGDILAVHTVGAYGFCMSSNYNSRRRACEVLVDGDRFGVIRDRDSFDDLVRGEHVQPHWVE